MIRRRFAQASRLALLASFFLAVCPALPGQRPYNPTPGALGAGGAVTSVSGLIVQVAAGNVLCLGVVDNLATVNIAVKARATSYVNYDCGIHAVIVDANPPTSPVQYQMAKVVAGSSTVTITDARDPSVFIPTGSIGGGVHSVTTPLGSGLIISAGPDPIVTLDPAIVQTGPLTGDVTTSGVVATLASVGTAGTFGDSTHSVTVTYDAKGRETAVSAPLIAFPVTSVYGRTSAVVAAANDYNFNQLAGSAACSQLPALTGAATSSAGSCATSVADAGISFTDITTNNVSTTKHGFTPKLPNDATKYLDGTGAYTVPPGIGGGTAAFAGPFPLADGIPDGTGNVFYSSVAFTSPYVHAHWEWDKANTVKDLSFRFRYPHSLPTGAAKIILANLAANDATAGHTMTFKECDKQVTTIENPASYTCTATQNFTTTSTAYAPSDLTFVLNDTPVADKEVEVYIECTAASGLTNNVITGGVYIEWQ